MAALTKDQIKKMTEDALRSVADFTGEIENFSFQPFHEFHKTVFLNNLKRKLYESPFFDHDGNTSFTKYYDVAFNAGVINNWHTIKDCIEFVQGNQTVSLRPSKLQL